MGEQMEPAAALVLLQVDSAMRVGRSQVGQVTAASALRFPFATSVARQLQGSQLKI